MSARAYARCACGSTLTLKETRLGRIVAHDRAGKTCLPCLAAELKPKDLERARTATSVSAQARKLVQW